MIVIFQLPAMVLMRHSRSPAAAAGRYPGAARSITRVRRSSGMARRLRGQ
ncbi:hypothetical protein ACFMQL_39465 [Nonomuraea fastidiosa]